MAAALLERHLRLAGSSLTVASAGTLGWSDRRATPEAVDVIDDRGVDISSHRARKLADYQFTRIGLVVAMTRDHAGALANRRPEYAGRTFLPAELVRLGTAVGPRGARPLGEWADDVGATRGPAALFGRAMDEIPDPAGHNREVYEATAARLDGVMAHIAQLIA